MSAARAERQRQRASARLAHVEADAALAARRVVEGEGAVRRVGLDGDGAQQIEMGARFDADHLGAELGEQRADLGRDRGVAEDDGAQAGERPRRSARCGLGAGWRGGAARAASAADAAGEGTRHVRATPEEQPPRMRWCRTPQLDRRGREVERRDRERRVAEMRETALRRK